MEPIRILQVVTYMGRGGLETMLMNYYRRMNRQRVQFDFLVHRSFRGDYDDEIESLGGRIYRLPRLVPWSGSYRRALDTFFRAHPEYRIVHVHQDCLSAVILKAAMTRGVSVRIAHSHTSSQDKGWKYPIKLFYRRQIPRYATALMACGRAAGDWMFRGAPYEILQNAIDVERYAFRPETRQRLRRELGLPQDCLVAGHVGQFRPVKNHGFLLDAFAELKKRRPDARLLVVGDGERRPATEEKAAAMGIQDSVIFTGLRQDVPELMQAMDCFVFPSHYEGLSMSLLEAQAAGLPCLISQAIPEECDVTPLVKRLPLEAGAAAWGRAALDWAATPRMDTGEALTGRGFDIAANARWLENYYLERWKEC